MAILEELKAKANGAADTANNIQEAVSMMEFGGGSGSGLKYVKDDPSDKGGVIEGNLNINAATGAFAHAEGSGCTASGMYSHAEGAGCTASDTYSHAEGSGCTASSTSSHAEGAGTQATSACAHSEGGGTIASGNCSHAEGAGSTASGPNSHAEGGYTIAQRANQHVCGMYNVADTGGNSVTSNGTYVVIVGNGPGIGSTPRSNAFAMKWDGTFVFANGTEITPAQFASLLQLLG